MALVFLFDLIIFHVYMMLFVCYLQTIWLNFFFCLFLLQRFNRLKIHQVLLFHLDVFNQMHHNIQHYWMMKKIVVIFVFSNRQCQLEYFYILNELFWFWNWIIYQKEFLQKIQIDIVSNRLKVLLKFFHRKWIY